MAHEALTAACWIGDLAALEAALQMDGARPTAWNNWCLRVAAQRGHAAVVRRLLAIPEVDPTTFNSVALREAAGAGHVDVVKVLLSDGRADPRARNDEALRDVLRMARRASDDAARFIAVARCFAQDARCRDFFFNQ